MGANLSEIRTNIENEAILETQRKGDILVPDSL